MDIFDRKSESKLNTLRKKQYKLDKILYFVELIFEENPYLLRKIKLKHNDIFYTISFFNHNYNENFSRNFFSLAPSLIKN